MICPELVGQCSAEPTNFDRTPIRRLERVSLDRLGCFGSTSLFFALKIRAKARLALGWLIAL
ncbi:MAG: hypothetical protein DME34_09600 [Verrucomicrobia bacterium]|nr:MAG: hypothetical protein DME34_09600 [Verrucomicrobiota bacterium]